MVEDRKRANKSIKAAGNRPLQLSQGLVVLAPYFSRSVENNG